jgi:hypothetical protein
MADQGLERYLLSYIVVLVVAYLAVRYHRVAVNEAYANGRQNRAVEMFMAGGQVDAQGEE